MFSKLKQGEKKVEPKQALLITIIKCLKEVDNGNLKISKFIDIKVHKNNLVLILALNWKTVTLFLEWGSMCFFFVAGCLFII